MRLLYEVVLELTMMVSCLLQNEAARQIAVSGAGSGIVTRGRFFTDACDGTVFVHGCLRLQLSYVLLYANVLHHHT